jgi:hypothetical protein
MTQGLDVLKMFSRNTGDNYRYSAAGVAVMDGSWTVLRTRIASCRGVSHLEDLPLAHKAGSSQNLGLEHLNGAVVDIDNKCR